MGGDNGGENMSKIESVWSTQEDERGGVEIDSKMRRTQQEVHDRKSTAMRNTSVATQRYFYIFTIPASTSSIDTHGYL